MNNQELHAAYQKFNAEYFHGTLPDMPVRFSEALYGQGAFECVLRETGPLACEMIPGTGSIEISIGCEDWEGVLLHEMVHAYFAVAGLGRERHGPLFQDKCAQIEQLRGQPIPRNLRGRR